MPNVLLFADEPVLADGMRRVVENTPGMTLSGACFHLHDLAQLMELYRPDILLVDLTPDITFGVLQELRETAGNSGIVLWSNNISTELALQAVSLGVRGIIRRTAPVGTLIRCLQCVSAGELWFEKALTDSIATARRYSLT